MPPTASAPGKVMLCGEYAVLGDAPAICMAVNRRAVVDVAAIDGACHELSTPGYRPGRWRFRQAGGGIEWLDTLPSPDSFALFAALLARAAPPLLPACSFTLDSRAFVDPGSQRKLGLGSSAAIAVALGAVLGRSAGRPRDTAGIAHAAHREFQRGSGSGADVATCLAGGLVEFCRAAAARPRRLAWPRALHCTLLWSGTAASTPRKLATLKERPRAAAAGALQHAARAAAAAWRRGNGAEVLDLLRDYTDALGAFDRAYELGIFDAGHRELAASAAAHGVVYKPCGAGGGDIGAVFAASAAEADGFIARAAAAGFGRLDAGLDDCGLVMTNGGTN